MATKRYGEEPLISRPLTGTDLFCISESPYNPGDPFFSVPMTRVSEFVSTTLAPLYFAGTWNATTNSPTLTSGIGTNGAVYVVSVSGTTNLDGHNNWQVGDWAVFDGNINQWTQVANEVIQTINIYNSDGSLTGARTLNTNAFNLTMNGAGNINLDVPNLYLTPSSGNTTTIGSATYDGIANVMAQTLKGKFTVVVDDDTGIYSNTFLRFSSVFPNIVAMGKSNGTETAPLAVGDNELVSVCAHAVYDGQTYLTKPNFNSIMQELVFTAPGQAAGNNPGAYMMVLTLSGDGSAPTPFMQFNLGGLAGAAFGPNTASNALNSVVLGNNISSVTADEVLIGNTVGLTTISSPIVNIDAPQINLTSSPYSGGGDKYLTVNNSGTIVPVSLPADINIYNTDGTLTGNRILTLDGHNLSFFGAGGEMFLSDTAITQIGTNNGQFFYVIARMFLNYAPFIGGGNQVIGVDGSGQLITIVPQNIYNHDDSLTGNRVVNMTTHTLRFSGSSNFSIDSGVIDLGLTSSTQLQLRATTFINQSGFIGGGNQFIGVNNSGQLQTMSLPPSTNIYNSDGSLTGNRTLTLGTDSLNFSGSAGSTFNITVPNVAIKGLLSTTNDPGAVPFTINYNNTIFSSQFFSLNSNVGQFGAIIENINNGNTTMLGFARSLGTDQSSRAIVTPGTLIGWIDFFGYDGITYRQGASIQSTVLTASAGTVTTRFDFTAEAFAFTGIGGVTFGSGCSATGATSFSQGNTNIVSTIQSAALGGLLNTVNGLSSGTFVSNGCTINAGSGTAGYGLMIGAYNCVGTDNLTATFFSSSSVNNGLRSGIFGGQVNKINAPNTLLSSDNFIFGGNTNTMTGNVFYSTIAQSDSCIIGDNTNSLSGCWTLNSVSCSALPNSSIGNGYMVDLNGTNNTIKSHYSFLINCKSNIITSSTFGLGGRYFLANAVSYSVPAGNYVGTLNALNGTLNGNYSTQLSCNLGQFASSTLYSSILAGDNQILNGTRSAILCGLGNTINNFDSSAAIGSAITINHNNCILINDGALPLASGGNGTIIIQASNGAWLGKGVNTPQADSGLGKTAVFYPIALSSSFNTAANPAITYHLTATGTLTMTLSDVHKVPGIRMEAWQVGGVGTIILTPASGTINGAPNLTVVGMAIITSDGSNWFARNV